MEVRNCTSIHHIFWENLKYNCFIKYELTINAWEEHKRKFSQSIFITILLGKISTPNQHGNFENHKYNLRQCDNPPIAKFEEHIMNDSAIYNPKPTPMQSFMTLESLMKAIQGLNKYTSAKVQHITTQLEFRGILKRDQQLQRKSFTHEKPYC